MAINDGHLMSPPKLAPSSSMGRDKGRLLTGLGGGGLATIMGAEGMVLAGKEDGSGEKGKSRSRASDSMVPEVGKKVAMLNKSVSTLGPECSSLVFLACSEGDSSRECQQLVQGGHLSSLEGANETHEMVTSCLNKALLAVSEAGAVEMMSEENREAAGSSTGNPKHI